MASVGSAIMSVGSSASAPRDNDDAIAATSKERKDSWTYEANLGSRTVADVEASGSSRGGGSTRNLLSGERQTLQALCHTSSPHLTLITAHISIAGFQLYTNVDWILSRDRIFSTFAVYTGRADHIAHMAVAEFSADSSAYSPAVRRAFKQFEGDKLRMHETGPGVVMVGNAEWFSKASSPCLLVPSGDFDAELQTLHVNINLRRIGCGERSLLSYRPPSQAVIDKFYHMTNIQPSPLVPFQQAVLTLVILVQQALVMLALFSAEYVDGLLCDTTSDTLREFYNTFGPFQDAEIDPGNWCDPALLAVVLRTVEQLRQRLGALGYTVKGGAGVAAMADQVGLERQIKSFQKSQGLRVTRIFDRKTVAAIDYLYVRLSPQAQAVAAVSTTVNVLRSKIENITGLPTGSNRRPFKDRDMDSDDENYYEGGGMDRMIGGDARDGDSRETQGLDWFLKQHWRASKRMEKQVGRKKDKEKKRELAAVAVAVGPGEGSGILMMTGGKQQLSSAGGSIIGQPASQPTPMSASASTSPMAAQTASSPSVATPSPGTRTSPNSLDYGFPATSLLPQPAMSLRSDMGGTPAARFSNNPATAASNASNEALSHSLSTPQPFHHSHITVEEATTTDDETQLGRLRATPARVLRGFKDSTSRTLEGIVEKGKAVKKGMKQFAHNVKDSTNPLGGFDESGGDVYGEDEDAVEGRLHSHTQQQQHLRIVTSRPPSRKGSIGGYSHDSPSRRASSLPPRSTMEDNMDEIGENPLLSPPPIEPDSGDDEERDHVKSTLTRPGRGSASNRGSESSPDGKLMPPSDGAGASTLANGATLHDANAGDASPTKRTKSHRRAVSLDSVRKSERGLVDLLSGGKVGASGRKRSESQQQKQSSQSSHDPQNHEQQQLPTRRSLDANTTPVLLTSQKKLSPGKGKISTGGTGSGASSRQSLLAAGSGNNPADDVMSMSPQPSPTLLPRGLRGHSPRPHANSAPPAPSVPTTLVTAPTEVSLDSASDRSPAQSTSAAAQLPLHPRLAVSRSNLTRQTTHLSHSIKSTIPQLLQTFDKVLESHQEHLAAYQSHTTQVQALAQSLQARSQSLTEHLEKVETEVMKVRYSVGVVEERTGETEEAVLGFLNRVGSIKAWFSRVGAGKGWHLPPEHDQSTEKVTAPDS